jgi:hypothetical protein
MLSPFPGRTPHLESAGINPLALGIPNIQNAYYCGRSRKA